MTASDRIAASAEHVRTRLFEAASASAHEYTDPDYRWLHTLRVARIGRELPSA